MIIGITNILWRRAMKYLYILATGLMLSGNAIATQFPKNIELKYCGQNSPITNSAESCTTTPKLLFGYDNVYVYFNYKLDNKSTKITCKFSSPNNAVNVLNNAKTDKGNIPQNASVTPTNNNLIINFNTPPSNKVVTGHVDLNVLTFSISPTTLKVYSCVQS